MMAAVPGFGGAVGGGAGDDEYYYDDDEVLPPALAIQSDVPPNVQQMYPTNNLPMSQPRPPMMGGVLGQVSGELKGLTPPLSWIQLADHPKGR